MTKRSSERGAALLTVLMLVAVMATIVASALDRLTVATRLAANSEIAVQNRMWLGLAEQLAALRLEDLVASDLARTMNGPWFGRVREIRLSDGGVLKAEVRDGGNCFNLNSLARRQPDGQVSADPWAVGQFATLLNLLGVDRSRANGIAAAAGDWVDSDSAPLPGGNETGGADRNWSPGNSQFAEVSELGGVAGVSPELLTIASPFLCALPAHEATALNPNTLLPEQAPVLAMLAPEQIGLTQARAMISARPAGGYTSTIAFWQASGIEPNALPPQAAEQIRLKTRWFELKAEVEQSGQTLASTTLIDLREPSARIVRRRYGDL